MRWGGMGAKLASFFPSLLLLSGSVPVSVFVA